jgi:hypothetical protein
VRALGGHAGQVGAQGHLEEGAGGGRPKEAKGGGRGDCDTAAKQVCDRRPVAPLRARYSHPPKK